MNADLHIVGDEYVETLIECRRRWAALGAKLLQCELPGATTYELAHKAELMAGQLGDAFGRLAKLAEREEQ